MDWFFAFFVVAALLAAFWFAGTEMGSP